MLHPPSDQARENTIFMASRSYTMGFIVVAEGNFYRVLILHFWLGISA
jgi:hypothetical protein